MVIDSHSEIVTWRAEAAADGSGSAGALDAAARAFTDAVRATPTSSEPAVPAPTSESVLTPASDNGDSSGSEVSGDDGEMESALKRENDALRAEARPSSDDDVFHKDVAA